MSPATSDFIVSAISLPLKTFALIANFEILQELPRHCQFCRAVNPERTAKDGNSYRHNPDSMNFLSSTEMSQIVSRSFLTIIAILAIATAASATDFDRDGKADFAIFRPASTTWLSAPSSPGAKAAAFQWGHASDVLVPSDYDADGQTDFAVWRPENGVWYIHQSGDDSVLLVRWGMTTMHPT